MRTLSLAYAGLALLIGLLVLLAYAATRPDDLPRRAPRCASPHPPAKLWPLVGELRAFNRWNPYERKDPADEGQPTTDRGAGHRLALRLAERARPSAVGSLEITAQQPGRAVQMKLDFVKPFEAHNQAELSLQPTPDGATEVRWAMSGPANFVSKLMGVFIDMDKMVGRDFEDGLQNLRQLAEVKA